MADDVILAEVAPGSDLDQFQRDFTGVFQTVANPQGDVDGLVLLEQKLLLAAGHTGRAAHHHPVLGAVAVLLHDDLSAGIDDDAFGLEALPLHHGFRKPPGPVGPPVDQDFRPFLGPQGVDQGLDILNAPARRNQHGIGGLDHDVVHQPHGGNQPAGGLEIGIPDVVDQHVAVDHVLGGVLGADLPEGLPRAEVVPAGVQRHHHAAVGFFHDGVVDRVTRTGVEGRFTQAHEIEVRPSLGDRLLAGGNHLGRQPLHFSQHLRGPEHEHPAVPAVVSRSDIGRCGRLVRLFDEGRDLQGLEPAVEERPTLADAAVAGFRRARHDPEGDQVVAARKVLGDGQRGMQPVDLRNEVVGRQHQQRRVVQPGGLNGGHRHGRGGIAAHRLEDDGPGRHPDRAQLLGSQKTVVLVADHNRGAHPGIGAQPQHGILKHGVLAHQVQHLFGVERARKGPEAGTGARGAQVTDIVILVVAADDGVMPQTIEAINHAKASEVPIIVAVNKMDKPNADPERIQRQLAEVGLMSEDWGGDTIFVKVSAKQNQGIDGLLEMILLQSEVLELKANPNKLASGHVVESKLDSGRGPVATILIQDGTLRAGDPIVCGIYSGKVRAMLNDLGLPVDEAGPSIPVEILGLTGVPGAGDEFVALADEKNARQVSQHRAQKQRAKELAKTSRLSLESLFERMKEGEVKDLNLIIKADVDGSIEALRDSLVKLSNEEVKINVIHAATGTITESDVSLAAVSDAIIIGFNVRPNTKVADMADEEHVDIRYHNIIYNVIKEVKDAIVGMMESTYEERILGLAEVREVFHVPKVGAIAGAYVTEGKIERGQRVRLLRDGIIQFEGKIASLRRFKDDVKEVQHGYECGIGIENYNDIKVGDEIQCFFLEEIKPALA